MVKIGIIGVGFMCRNHLRVLSEMNTVEIVFLFEPNSEPAANIAEKYNNIKISQGLDYYLTKVDAVIITSPTSTHFDYLLKLIGKVNYIFVEKPLTATYFEARKIIELQKNSVTKIYTGFIERFNPAVLDLKPIVENSNVINIDFTRTNQSSARIKDVDVVADLMIHDIDLAIYLNGEVESVHASGYQIDGMLSFCIANLKHNNGSLSRLLASRLTHVNERSIKINSEDSFISCNLLQKEVSKTTRLNPSRNEKNIPNIDSTIEIIKVNTSIDALTLELKAFIEVCKGGFNQILANSWDGYKAAMICDIIQKQSIHSGSLAKSKNQILKA
jgi:predicted dehydrogenase